MKQIKTCKTKQYYCSQCKDYTSFKVKQPLTGVHEKSKATKVYWVISCSICKWSAWTSNIKPHEN